MKKFTLGLLIFGFINCVNEDLSRKKEDEKNLFSIIYVNENEGILLPNHLGPQVINRCSRSSPNNVSGFWQPTIEDLTELEKLLPNYLSESFTKDYPEIFENLEVYKRQYIGINKGAKKFIYVNALIYEPYIGDSWRWEAFNMCDGGSNYWGIEYDPDTKTFTNFDVNIPLLLLKE